MIPTQVILAKYLVFVFPLYSFYLLLRKEYKTFFLLIAAAVLAKGAEAIVGQLVIVPRPFEIDPKLPFYREVVSGGLSKLLRESRLPGDSSFFSAHAAVSFASATVAYLADSRRVGTGLLIVAGLVSAGRVLANVHYPGDVIVGAVVGTIIGVSVIKAAGSRSLLNAAFYR